MGISRTETFKFYREHWDLFIDEFILRQKSVADKCEYKMTTEQRDAIRDVNNLKRTSITMRAGKGKTAVAAWLALTYTMLYNHSKVVVTSPVVDNVLWPEIEKWIKGSGMESVLQQTRNYIKQIDSADCEQRIYKRRPNSIMGACGIHAEHLLVICDETDSMPYEVLDAYNGALVCKDNKMVILNRGYTF